MSGGSRQAHSKSRRGCAQCKKRRVRCDLRPPVCSNCARRGEECEYLSLQIFYTPPVDPGSRPIKVTVVPCTERTPPSAEPINDPLDELLVLHYKTTTAKTLSMRPLASDRDPWQHDIIQRMETSRFLWHGVLSISALHLCFLQPDQNEHYFLRACQHLDQALPLFRSTVTEVNKDNVIEVIAFCVIQTIFHFFVSNRDSLRVPADPREFNVFCPLLTIRSGSHLVHQSLDVVAQHGGVLKETMGSLWKLPPPALDEDIMQAAEGLDAVAAVLANMEPASIVLEAIDILKQSFIRFSTRPKGWLHIVFWPASISLEYGELLNANNQTAMVVFVYWCASMTQAPKMWWLDGCTEAAGKQFLRQIDRRWYDLLAWPRSKLGDEVGTARTPTQVPNLMYKTPESIFTEDSTYLFDVVGEADTFDL